MSTPSAQDRFEELEAGRILGDLDAGELREWKELSASLGARPDFSLELTAAAIETEFLRDKTEALPTALTRSLREDMTKFTRQASGTGSPELPFPLWRRLLSSGETAWAVAAVLAALLVATFLSQPSPTTPTPESAKVGLLERAPDLVKASFSGVERYTPMSGEVIWSDREQEGYMTLTNLPANDPAKNQYQLWIVDPGRDDKPVDGGVFDIPAGETTAVIPIRNPLAVSRPRAFVITLEQPGGVVVSKQEVVVALAKPS